MLVILLLLAAWGIVLVPSIGTGRKQVTGMDGFRSFQNTMGLLANTRTGQIPGRWIMVPTEPATAVRSRRSRVVRRRRQTFERLAIACAVTFVLGLLPGMRTIWMANIACDVVLVGYVMQLKRWQNAEAQRARVVRRLRTERRVTDDLFASQSG